MPLDPVLISIREFLWEIVLVGLLSVLAGGIGVWLMVRSAVRPLWKVRASAEALAAGGNPEAIDVQLADEIGALARTFNRMAERVRAANEALLERAEQLERRNHELRQSELRYRQLVDQSPEAIIVHRGASIIFANSVAAQLLGAQDADALRGLPILERVDPEDRDRAAERIAAIAETKIPSPPGELRMRRVDGGVVHVEVTGTAIEFDGAPAVQTWARDITSRLSLEAQLRQSQKMEAVGRLAGGVAHDFNNLLSVIRTYAELTIASMAPDDPNRPGLEDIRHAATSAAQLTKQMLAFSRKQVLNPQVLDLNEAIAAMTGMLHRTLGDHIDVQTSLRSDLAPVWADASQLEQILVNLAVNARDAMPQGGTIRIETANASLDVGYASTRGEPIPANDYVMLAVSDTGTGMTEDVKANIFEPFFTTKESHGTGLGLATVYGIVKQSGGYIWVYSEPGQGTSFKLFFPQHRGSEEVAPVPEERPAATPRDARVLLVEDDAMVRTAVRRILERSAFAIVEAASGVEGAEIFAQHDGAFDLVITDMMMPGMTGAELIRQLRERNPGLRAIIMSGYSEETTAREWRLPPNTSFVEKPISPRVFLQVIDEVLGAQTEAEAWSQPPSLAFRPGRA
jgi:PAS domain S-box-containing protein